MMAVKSRFFGLNGKELAHDGPDSLAKSVTGKTTVYFCKFQTTGVEAGHLVNPWSMYADEQVQFTNPINKYTGKQFQEYKQVSEDTFKLYVRYLQSRSDVHYRQAERLVLENA